MPRLRSPDASWLFAALIVASIGALTSWRIDEDYRETVAAAYARLASLARAGDEQVSGSIRTLDLLATEVAAMAGQDGGWPVERVEAYMRTRALDFPEVRTIFIGDAAGIIVAATKPNLRGYDGSRRPYFQLPQQPGKEHRLTLSAPTMTALGNVVTFAARGIRAGDGPLLGVVGMSLSERYFEGMLESVRPEDEGSVVLVNPDQIVIARVPDQARFLGQDLSETQAVQEHQKAFLRTTFHRVRSPLDHIDRLVVMRRLGVGFLTLAVTQGAEPVLAPWRKRSLAHGGGFVLVAAVTLVLTRLARRRAQDSLRLAAQLADNQALEQEVIAHSGVGIAVYAASGACLMANAAYAAIAGGDPAQVSGQNFHRLESWRKSGMAAMALRALETGEVAAGDFHVVSTFGREIWIGCRFVRFHRDGIPHLLVMIDDITRRIAADAEARLAASVFQTTRDGIMVTDAGGTIVSVNPAFIAITGYDAAEAVGANPSLLKSDHQDEAFYAAMWRSLREEGHWQGEIWNRRKNGEAFLEWLTVTAIRDEAGAIQRYVGVFADITELRRADETIKRQAYHDAMTGLPNRLLLHDRLDHALAVARRDGSGVAVLFIDLDRFKAVNDNLGHEVGDRLLQAASKRLLAIIRRSDTVARLGGDEFLVVLGDLNDTDEAARVAEKIVSSLAEPFDLGDRLAEVGCSVGIAMFPGDGEDVATLIRNADAAMYQAKGEGRGAFRFFKG